MCAIVINLFLEVSIIFNSVSHLPACHSRLANDCSLGVITLRLFICLPPTSATTKNRIQLSFNFRLSLPLSLSFHWWFQCNYTKILCVPFHCIIPWLITRGTNGIGQGNYYIHGYLCRTALVFNPYFDPPYFRLDGTILHLCVKFATIKY